MREYNPKHHSRATFTNSRVKFVQFPVPCCRYCPMLLLAPVVIVVVVIGVCSNIPSGIFIFPVCPKLAAVVEFTLAVFDDVRGVAPRPRSGSGSGFESGCRSRTYIRPSSNFLFYEWQNCCCLRHCCCYYYLLSFSLGKFSKMPASRASARGDARRGEARQGHGHRSRH